MEAAQSESDPVPSLEQVRDLACAQIPPLPDLLGVGVKNSATHPDQHCKAVDNMQAVVAHDRVVSVDNPEVQIVERNTHVLPGGIGAETRVQIVMQGGSSTEPSSGNAEVEVEPQDDAEPSPKGSDMDVDLRSEASAGRRWLQGLKRWSLTPHLQPENRLHTESKDPNVDGTEVSGEVRSKDDMELPAGPRRWLQRVIVRKSNTMPEKTTSRVDGSSEYDGSSEDEIDADGKGPHWLKGWLRPQQRHAPKLGHDSGNEDSMITSDEEIGNVLKDIEAGTSAADGVTGVPDCIKVDSGNTLLQEAYHLAKRTASAHGSPGNAREVYAVDREALGRLFHISDHVE